MVNEICRKTIKFEESFFNTSTFVLDLYSLCLCSVVGSDQIIGLFCKSALSKRRYSAKETYNFCCLVPVSQYRVAKTHRMPYVGHFSRKSH